MNKLLYVVFILSLIGCTQSEDNKNILINIQASGIIQLIPDIATISIQVSCTNKDLSKSNTCTINNINELFKILKQHKILNADYHSSRINLEKKYIWRKNSQIFNGYQSSSVINIVFKNLDTMSKVLTKIMLMRNIEISNLNYSHSNIDALANQAYLKALDNSKKLADEIKIKLNGQDLEIIEISNINGAFSKNSSANEFKEKAMRAVESDFHATIKINPGKLRLTKNIYVLYNLKFK